MTNQVQPGSEYEETNAFQHQITLDHNHEKKLAAISFDIDKTSRTTLAITDAITPFLIDLKVFSFITPLITNCTKRGALPYYSFGVPL